VLYQHYHDRELWLLMDRDYYHTEAKIILILFKKNKLS
jgi:hypothetical protein